MSRDTFELTLVDAVDIAPQTKHFIFKAPNTIRFLPGQFITLYFTRGDDTLRRSYSLANYGQEGTDRLELAASYVPNGVASECLFHMKPGDTLPATGPVGRLTLRNEAVKRYLLIATGTGVTPYRAMLPELARRLQAQPDLQIVLLFGVRHQEDALYQEEFAQFAKDHARFEFRLYYSRVPSPRLDYEYTGYVTHALAQPWPKYTYKHGVLSYFEKLYQKLAEFFSQHAKDKIHINPNNDMAFLCGNPNMVDDAYHLLAATGLKNDKIRREKYISPK